MADSGVGRLAKMKGQMAKKIVSEQDGKASKSSKKKAKKSKVAKKY